MQSFYGGRSGFSFVISKSYLSIAEMIADFQKGPEFEAVHFNEYVLINTEDKNDKDNGKIFRRGYDYTNEMGGAQYVGTIVGPAGMAPHVELNTYKNIEDMPKEEGIQYRYSHGDWSVDNEALVPGKVDGGEEDTFNDVIKWNCYSVRTPNNDDCVAYIGFEIPYPVIDFTAKSVDAYYNRDDDGETTDFNNIDLITREDDKSHPFFEQWHIAVPKGIKGDTFKNLRVVDAGDEEVTIETYDGQEDDVEGHRSVWVVDYEHYDKNGTGEPVTQYIGDYNIIKSINIDEEGVIHLEYTHNDEETLNLRWLKGLDVNENGEIVLHFTNAPDVTLETKIKWIDNISIDTGVSEEGQGEGTGTQKVHVVYNTGEEEDIGEPLNYIMATAVTDDYHLIAKHSSPTKRQQIVDDGLNYLGPDEAGYKGELDWQDLGSIKDDDGILIGLNLSQKDIEEDISSHQAAIDYLNNLYPNGLIGDNLTGKVVTIGYEDNTKLFYAFDYTTLNNGYKGWYYLGSLQLDLEMVITVAEITEEEKLNTLDENGVWLRIEDNIYLDQEGE